MEKGTSKQILLVEDDTDVQEIVKMALQEFGGYHVDVASSGQEALLLVAKKVPGLILLDVMMPDMDGPSTLQKLRKIPSLDSIPVIFMTAKVQPHEVEHYKKLGAKGVIAKPFDPLHLAEEIETIRASRE